MLSLTCSATFTLPLEGRKNIPDRDRGESSTWAPEPRGVYVHRAQRREHGDAPGRRSVSKGTLSLLAAFSHGVEPETRLREPI